MINIITKLIHRIVEKSISKLFFVGIVIEKIDVEKYRIKSFTGEEVIAKKLFQHHFGNGYIHSYLQLGEKVLLLNLFGDYVILGSIKNVKHPFPKDYPLIIKPNSNGTEIIIDEKNNLFIKTPQQKMIFDVENKKLTIKTKNDRTINIDDLNQQINITTNEWSVVIDDSNKIFNANGKNGLQIKIDKNTDEVLIRSNVGYGFKVEGDKVEIRGNTVDFYNTPFD